MGRIPSGVLYRSSSPIDPKQGERRFAADDLLWAAGVVTAVNTSDCRLRFRNFKGFHATHYAALGERNQVALNMGHDYPSDAFLEDMYNGLDFLTERPGPYLIHGTEGVERAGYVCMVLEALMGASKEEILADYLRSYEDYYRLDKNSKDYKAAQRQAVSNLLTFTGAENETALDTLDLAQATRTYLLEQVKLSETQIELLKLHLSGAYDVVPDINY